MKSLIFGSATLLVAGILGSVASCAESESSAPVQRDSSVPSPDVAIDAPAPGLDAGCDASESDCVTHEVSCNDAPWCPTPTTVSTSYALTSVWGTGKSDVWAVGSGGTIVHWDGNAWIRTLTTTKSTLRAVRGSGPNDVWAVAMTDTILHSNGFTNGSAEWTVVNGAVEPSSATAALSLWSASPGELRIGTRARNFYDPDSGEYPFIHQYTLKLDADGGIGWEPVVGEGNVYGIWGSSPEDLWIVADNSERQKWQKGMTKHGTLSKAGFEWKEVDSQSSSRLEGIWGSSANEPIWAVGELGTIRRMANGAARWEIIDSPTTENLHAVWGSRADDVWAVGDAGTILHWDGIEWKPSAAAFALGKKPDLRGVWGSAADDVWIVGDTVALHYTGPKGGGQ